MKRRTFLKLSALGFSGLSLGSKLLAQSSSPLATTMSQAALGFVDTLGDGSSTVLYAFDSPERTRWHWIPGFERTGLTLSDMNEAQRSAALALMQTGFSESGFEKVITMMGFQEERGADPQRYFFTVYGTPDTEPWGWRLEGHHLSVHYTVANNQVRIAPFFVGVSPTIGTAGERVGVKPMAREEEAARELVTSLGDAAIFQGNSLTNLATRTADYVDPLETVGVSASTFDETQNAGMLEIIQTYLALLPDEVASAQFAKLQEANLSEIAFGWAGSTEVDNSHYYRLQGNTFLLEFDNSRNSGRHIHSVWRDFAGDFGRDLL
jgi:hypothetical protein